MRLTFGFMNMSKLSVNYSLSKPATGHFNLGLSAAESQTAVIPEARQLPTRSQTAATPEATQLPHQKPDSCPAADNNLQGTRRKQREVGMGEERGWKGGEKGIIHGPKGDY